MAFGDSIAKLLETYTNCLKLLDVFKRHTSDEPDPNDAASLLQRSIKSDRSKVRKRYASRLSLDGKRLEKGDGEAKSILRRTLKKLNAAIVRLLHMGRDQNSVLDYDSLMRLSNASRIDAVNAIDQLSRRLGSSPSRRSLASSSAASASSAGGQRRRRSKGSDSGVSTSGSPKLRKDASKQPARKPSKEPETSRAPSEQQQQQQQQRSSPRSGGSKDVKTPSGGGGPKINSKSEDAIHRRDNSGSSRMSGTGTTGISNRMSMMSVSTNSTKLGEIPERRRRLQRQQSSDSGSSEDSHYNVRPTYPLKPYQPPAPKPKRGFWGLFGR